MYRPEKMRDPVKLVGADGKLVRVIERPSSDPRPVIAYAKTEMPFCTWSDEPPKPSDQIKIQHFAATDFKDNNGTPIFMEVGAQPERVESKEEGSYARVVEDEGQPVEEGRAVEGIYEQEKEFETVEGCNKNNKPSRSQHGTSRDWVRAIAEALASRG